MSRLATSLICTSLILLLTGSAFAQGPGKGRGPGFGRGQGFGRGPGAGRGMQHEEGGAHEHDDRHDEDHKVFQFLLENHEKIKRTVTNLADGVDTRTESDDPKIIEAIQEHVHWMEYRIENTNPIRMRDPLFRELFQHTDKIKMKVEQTEKGVRVIETSDDPHVAQLIQEHAKVVSAFVKNGFREAMKNHAVPGRVTSNSADLSYPVISDMGGVFQLKEAVFQPEDGAKLCIDVTRGGDKDVLNKALEKVTRFVNIYGGAGAEKANASFAVILHGDAVLTCLNDEAYAKEFGTDANPNLDCLHKLHEAGVEIAVCGQSLQHAGKSPADVAVFVDVAVSSLTAIVSLQKDGYSYVPMH